MAKREIVPKTSGGNQEVLVLTRDEACDMIAKLVSQLGSVHMAAGQHSLPFRQAATITSQDEDRVPMLHYFIVEPIK